MLSRFNPSGRLDSAALMLSTLCVLHCAAGLWLVAGVATAAGAAGTILSPWVHEVGLVIAAFIAALALGHGALRTGTHLPLAIGSLGIGIMAGALEMHDNGEMIFTIIGVGLVSAGHIMNFRLARHYS